MALSIRYVKNLSKNKDLVKHIKQYWGTSTTDWTSPEAYFFVVFDSKKWVGYGAMRVHDIESCYLGPTFVKEEYRGKGLQAKLIQKRIAFAKKLGFIKVISCTEIHNYHSSNNLIQCGLKLRNSWLGTNNTFLYWTKDI